MRASRMPVAAALAAALLIQAGCRTRRGVLMDHDGGIDDYVALLMVLNSPGRRLRAATVSFGNSYPEEAAAATRRILASYGQTIPVGVFQPSERGKNEFPPEWRHASAAVNTLAVFRVAGSATAKEAGRVLRRSLEESGRRKMEVLVTGPLTNLAAVLRKRERMVRHIGRLVVMGGALRVPGNAPGGAAEYNTFVDPEAAEYVFSLAARGLRIELVPLDATNHLPVTRQFLDRLLAGPAGPAQQAGQILGLAGGAISGESHYYLWDGAAALALLRPEVFSFEQLRLRVTPDGRTVEAPDGHGPIHAALGVRPGARPMEDVLAILKERPER